MPPGERGLVVGVDGGNSKTLVAVATLAGDVRAVRRGAGVRPQVVGRAETVAALRSLVDAALVDAGGTTDAVASAVLCLANVDTAAARRRMLADLAGIGADVEVEGDTPAVLWAGSPQGWGIGVVCGAGVNAMGRAPDGRTARLLSLGRWTGDRGGGFDLGIEALAAAVRAADGRGPATALRQAVPSALGARTAPAVSVALDAGSLPSLALIDLAPVVLDVAASGDAVARRIVDGHADELALMVTTLLRRLRLLRSPAPVVLGGSVLQRGRPEFAAGVRDRVLAVAARAEVRVLDVPPVAGALDRALARAGASDAVRRRARAAHRSD